MDCKWPNSFLISEAAVVGRGCSTKDKVFYKECETHSYGDSLEKMCFCSFQLCNRSAIQLNCPSLWTLTLLTLSTVLASWTFPGWIWDPWPPFAQCCGYRSKSAFSLKNDFWIERKVFEISYIFLYHMNRFFFKFC